MKWRKLGLIYSPNEANWWQKSGYAFLPTADYHDGVLRVYFASLDEHRFGRIGYVELDAGRIDSISNVSAEPVLDIGELGAFDDCGVTPSCLVHVGDRALLYYIGWQRCERVPYMLFSGLAIGTSGGFERRARTPVLDRTGEESLSRSAPCVRIEDGAFRVWYWSCSRWTTDDDGVRYNTVIRHARSHDGIRWQSCGDVCLAPEGADYALGRPWVVKDSGVYKMWFAIRSRGRVTYRIGYAESSDGLSWTRKDSEAGISPSDSGWDSEMICHPCVVDVPGQRLMFYTGNRHGSEGFGCAVLERD